MAKYTDEEIEKYLRGTSSIKVEIIAGPTSNCVSLDDHRIAGPKPWGGGSVTLSEDLGFSDIDFMIGVLKKEKRKLANIKNNYELAEE